MELFDLYKKYIPEKIYPIDDDQVIEDLDRFITNLIDKTDLLTVAVSEDTFQSIENVLCIRKMLEGLQ